MRNCENSRVLRALDADYGEYALRFGGPYAMIEEFLVAESQRGKGLARPLLAAARAEAERRGCRESQVNGPSPEGTLNKTSALLKDAVLEAADIAGGKAGLVGYLALQARENPVAFMGLLGKLIPSQIAADVTQSVATVTAEIMTPEEWAEHRAELLV
jgi:GNAT superfamily N-acetyltransferase